MDPNVVGALPLLLVVLVVPVVDAGVFTESRAREIEGRRVFASVGPVTLSTPAQWLLGCLVLWILVVPMYLVARKA